MTTTATNHPTRRRALGAVALLAALVCAISPHTAHAQPAPQSSVTAIDILLEPDAVMFEHAQAANGRLLANYPAEAPLYGMTNFPLDATHRPHITVIQRYVKTADLDKIYAAAEKILISANIAGAKLEAFKYYYIPVRTLGLAGISIRPTAGLLRLQQDLIDAVAPYTVETATAAAFFTTPDAPGINKPTIDYIGTFVPNQMGQKYNPHVTVGLAQQDYLNKLLAKPFPKFTFSSTGASVYQLGDNGAARKLLKTLKVAP